MGVFHQSLANDLSQIESLRHYIASLHHDVMNAHGHALFQFVRKVSLDVGSSLHDNEIVGLSPMALR